MENNRNQIIDFKLLDEKGVTLVIKREDEIHPYISGNKYRKLKYNLEEAKKQGMKTLSRLAVLILIILVPYHLPVKNMVLKPLAL